MTAQLHVVQPVDSGTDDQSVVSGQADTKKRTRVTRPYPADSLKDALQVATAIAEHNAGKPFYRVSLAESMGRSPDSSAFRSFITSSSAFGLTKGSYKADLIELTDLGQQIVWSTSPAEKRMALHAAMTRIPLFASLLEHFKNNRVPEAKILQNTLIRQFTVDPNAAGEAVNVFLSTGRYVGVIVDVAGKERVLSVDEMRSRLGAQLRDDESGNEWDEAEDSLGDEPELLGDTAVTPKVTPPAAISNSQVFISHGKNKAVVEQLKELLTFGKLEPVVAVEQETTALPVPEKVFQSMRACGAGVIHIESELELLDKSGNRHTRINDNVLIEIGAALALYDKRVILLVKEGVKLPSNLQGLYRCDYAGDKLELDAAMKLLKTFNQFG